MHGFIPSAQLPRDGLKEEEEFAWRAPDIDRLAVD
jgi:hypothetical protein